jgi:hypothetical protein
MHRCCPSKYIPFDDLREATGTLHWKLNAQNLLRLLGKCRHPLQDVHGDLLLDPPGDSALLGNQRVGDQEPGRLRLFSPMDALLYGKKPKAFPAL